MHAFATPGEPRLFAVPYIVMPGQKLAALSFSVVVRFPGITWRDTPSLVVVHDTVS